MLKISFDFDDTLDNDRIQKLAKKYISDGHDVWITTTRMSNAYGNPNWNNDVFDVASKLGIPITKIQLTDGDVKWRYLKDFDIHYDDSYDDIRAIEKHLPNCVGIMIRNPNY